LIRAAEGGFKVIAVVEIMNGVIFSFTEDVFVDEIENDLPEIGAGVHSPVIQDGHGQRPVFAKRVLADSLKQLGGGNMSLRPLGGLLHQLGREIKRLADEDIGFSLVAVILGENLRQGFMDADFFPCKK
jgi:hypothetical protein